MRSCPDTDIDPNVLYSHQQQGATIRDISFHHLMIKACIEALIVLSEVRDFCMYCHEKAASALSTTNHHLSATKGDTLKP